MPPRHCKPLANIARDLQYPQGTADPWLQGPDAVLIPSDAARLALTEVSVLRPALVARDLQYPQGTADPWLQGPDAVLTPSGKTALAIAAAPVLRPFSCSQGTATLPRHCRSLATGTGRSTDALREDGAGHSGGTSTAPVFV